jgi:uncharacterized protein YndB with AHSA1/START domain
LSVTRVEKDFDNLTLTVVADFEAGIRRVWQLWADPRRLERWWGPPSHPATVERHRLISGGEVTYFMTGPTGERSRGWWRIISVDPPRSLDFIDGFADQDGTPIPGGPTTTVQVRLTERDSRTRMVVRSIFASREHMERIVSLGADEIFAQAVGQTDALLASWPSDG